MSQKRIELVFDNLIRNHDQLKELLATATKLVESTKGHARASDEAAAAHKRVAGSASEAHAGWLAMAAAAAAYAATVKTMTIDTAMYAARTQTLAVVTDQLARVNNLSVDAVRAQVQAVRSQGITTQESLQTINKMIFAQLDLAKSTNLARLAQDAAVIAGVNSSEALAGIIHGVTTRQPEVLRTYGILVTFEQDFAKAARQLGRELTAAEKTQVALNTVLNEGSKITGAYEASMLTAGKQLTSLKRYVDEARNAIGEGLVPALGTAVGWMTKLAKYAEENGEAFSKMAVGITAVGAGLMAAKMMPGPLPLKIGAGVAVAAGTYAFGTPNPIEYWKGQGGAAIESFRRQQEQINEQLKAPGLTTTDTEALRTRFKALEQFERQVVAMVSEELAKIARQRGKGIITGTEREILKIGDVDLGYGVAVTTRDIFGGLGRLENRQGAGGALFNQQGFDAAQALQMAEVAAKKLKARGELLEKIVDGLDKEALDPLAKLLLEVQAKLREAVQKYGPLTGREMAGVDESLQGALTRDILKRKLTPLPTDLSTTGFRYGWLPSVTQNVEVNPDVTAGILDQFRQRQLGSIRGTLDYQSRIAQLTAGPTGEVSAVQKIADLRTQAALREFQITRDRAKLETDLLDVKRDRTLSLLEIQQRQIERAYESAGHVFDALLAGGAGIRGFVLGQATTIARTMFQNVAGEIFKGAAGRLTVPGQGTADSPTFLGKLFARTPFGTDASAVKLDMSALKLNMAGDSLIRAAGALAMTRGAGGPMPSRTADLIAWTLGIPAGGWADIGTGEGPSGYGLPGGTIQGPGVGTGEGLQGGGGSSLDPFGGWKGGVGKGVGLAAAGAGAYGAYSGFKAGGTQGKLVGTASVLMAAAMIPGPQQPFVAAGAMILGAAAALLGVPKKKRGKELTAEAERRRFTEPTGSDYVTDIYGRGVDSDFRGGVRVYKTVNLYETNNISAMDSASFEEYLKRNPAPLSAGVTNAIGSGNAEDLVGTLRQVM